VIFPKLSLSAARDLTSLLRPRLPPITKSIVELCEETPMRVRKERLDQIEEEVRSAAYKIIDAKKATYYGIGMALTRITKAILGNEQSVLTVSAMLKGEFGQKDVFIGVPCIINQNGIQRILPVKLTEEELEKLAKSCQTLKESYESLS
jgi:L-lactate dehydrogenase